MSIINQLVSMHLVSFTSHTFYTSKILKILLQWKLLTKETWWWNSEELYIEIKWEKGLSSSSVCFKKSDYYKASHLS
jgi:hypothetical protein